MPLRLQQDAHTRFSTALIPPLAPLHPCSLLLSPCQGIVHEFYPAEVIGASPPAASTSAAAQPSSEPWTLTLINGLWSLLLSLGLLLSCLKVLQARLWRLGRGWLRGCLADYGVPLMVVAWSGLSFAVSPAPHVPRRVTTPNTWQVCSVGMRWGSAVLGGGW